MQRAPLRARARKIGRKISRTGWWQKIRRRRAAGPLFLGGARRALTRARRSALVILRSSGILNAAGVDRDRLPRRAASRGVTLSGSPAPEKEGRVACGRFGVLGERSWRPTTSPRRSRWSAACASATARASETNLRPAVTEALRRLYSLPRLPANPFFFLATALSAHSSHGNNRSVWSVPDAEVMDDLEDVTLVDGGNGQTCKMNRFSDAWGLPHVLRACDREGLTDVKTLLRRFPPSLYPTPGREQDPRNPACMRQALLSLQEGCMHRRKYQGAPSRVGLRVDLVVDAPTIAEGLQTFVEHIYDATEGVAAHGEQNAVRGVLLMPGKANWSSEARSRRRAVVGARQDATRAARVRDRGEARDELAPQGGDGVHRAVRGPAGVPRRRVRNRGAGDAGPRRRDLGLALLRPHVLHVPLQGQDPQGHRAHGDALRHAPVRIHVHRSVPGAARLDGVQRHVRHRGGADVAARAEEQRRAHDAHRREAMREDDFPRAPLDFAQLIFLSEATWI